MDIRFDYYSAFDIQKQLDEAAEQKDHAKRRPRTLKYSTDKFYNFRVKHKKKR